jgi:hypothetical protein
MTIWKKPVHHLVTGLLLMSSGCRTVHDGSSASSNDQPELHAVEGPVYEGLTGCQKEKILENRMRDTVYAIKPKWTGKEAAGVLTFVGPREQVGREFMSVPLDRSSDVMPANREKVVHTYGSVAAVRFVRDPNSPFTGVFAGNECAILRAAPGAGPGRSNLVPGIALKFLIDGKPSVNIFALYSLDGQEGVNYFKNTLTNFLAPPLGNIQKFALTRFNLANTDSTRVHAGHLARVESNGRSVDEANVKAAEQLYFVPNKEKLAFSDAPVADRDYRDDLESIPAGTKLYDVYGRIAGASENERIHIGYIETKTKFLSSEFGDKRLFFKHKKIESKPADLRSE